MDLIRAYSKRLDLEKALVRAVEQLRRASDEGSRAWSEEVRTTGRSDRTWRVSDRLSEAETQALVAAFRAGTPKWQLAERYGISMSSVKRLLRQNRP